MIAHQPPRVSDAPRIHSAAGGAAVVAAATLVCVAIAAALIWLGVHWWYLADDDGARLGLLYGAAAIAASLPFWAASVVAVIVAMFSRAR